MKKIFLQIPFYAIVGLSLLMVSVDLRASSWADYEFRFDYATNGAFSGRYRSKIEANLQKSSQLFTSNIALMKPLAGEMLESIQVGPLNPANGQRIVTLVSLERIPVIGPVKVKLECFEDLKKSYWTQTCRVSDRLMKSVCENCIIAARCDLVPADSRKIGCVAELRGQAKKHMFSPFTLKQVAIKWLNTASHIFVGAFIALDEERGVFEAAKLYKQSVLNLAITQKMGWHDQTAQSLVVEDEQIKSY